MLSQPVWSDFLQPASFRGINFHVKDSGLIRGRRVVVHEYPYRDVPYVEDLGRARQEINFEGFLVGDDVYDQRDGLAAVCDTPGRGTLVHPSLGSVQASLISASFGERAEDGRMVAIRLHFVIAEPIRYPDLAPAIGQSSLQLVPQFGLNMIGAAISDFVSVVQVVSQVTAVVVSTVNTFAGLVNEAAGTAYAVLSAVRGIATGQPYVSLGRYAQGNLLASVAPLSTAPSSTAATLAVGLSAAISAACSARATVATQVASVAALAAANDPSFGQSVATLVENARAAMTDPADQIQALLPLSAFTVIPAPLPGLSPLNTAMALATFATTALCRRAALVSIANACAAYAPTSSTQVEILIGQLLPAFDTEITSAADSGDLNSYLTLRDLRTQTIARLQKVGSQLPALLTITSAVSLPSLVWAQRLYNDARRSDELIGRADIANPTFMPLSFTALSA